MLTTDASRQDRWSYLGVYTPFYCLHYPPNTFETAAPVSFISIPLSVYMPWPNRQNNPKIALIHTPLPLLLHHTFFSYIFSIQCFVPAPSILHT